VRSDDDFYYDSWSREKLINQSINQSINQEKQTKVIIHSFIPSFLAVCLVDVQ